MNAAKAIGHPKARSLLTWMRRKGILKMGKVKYWVVSWMVYIVVKLDSRMASAIRLSHWKCVFAKIKGMIADMIEKIDKEGQKLLSSSSGATRKCVRKESIENDDKMDLCVPLCSNLLL